MKKLGSFFSLLFVMVVVAAVALPAFAGGRLVKDQSNVAIQGFAPTAGNGYEAKTKGTTTIQVTDHAALRYLCTADCTYKLNNAGASWLVKANAPETIYIPKNVTSVVFNRTSSATATGIYTQRQN